MIVFDAAWMNNYAHSLSFNWYIMYLNGWRLWYKNGQLHRDNKPAAQNKLTKSFIYYKNGQMHRENQPAFVVTYPSHAVIIREEKWYYEGKLHRDNGPAIVTLHRYDKYKEKYWYRHGVEYQLVQTFWQYWWGRFKECVKSIPLGDDDGADVWVF